MMANLNRWQRLAASTGLTLLALTPIFVSPLAEAVPVATRSSSSQGRSSAAAGAFTINKPAGTTVGDVMVASIGYRPCSSSSGGGCTTSITSPSGWTLIRLVEQKSGGGTGGYGLRLGIWYRVVTTADASVTNYRWNIGGAPSHNGAAGIIASFMHVDTTNPIVIDAGQTTASSRSHATPSIGVLATNTMLVSTHAALSSATWTPPAGMTEILDWASQTTPSALGMSLEINTQQLTTPGVAGTRTATFTVPNPPAADAGATHILALRPIQADPTISMARSGRLVVGSSASYALTIGNKGPMPIGAANITVTDTLPTGLTYTSASGTGWSCSAAGQVVTCTYSGSALAKDGTLPLLTLNFNVVSGSVWTNTATVSSGADGDNDLTNSTATDTWPTNTTTLATSSDPAASTIGPSALATEVNRFTLRTNTGTEPISAVTVNLSSPTGIDTLAITDNAGNVLGSVAFPTTSGAITIPVIGMTATTSTQTFKVQVTPLVHVSMPDPPGGTYTVTAPVTAWTGPAGHTGSDTNANALTIDNLSPNSATNTDATRRGNKYDLEWTSSSSSDFSTSSGSVVYRWASSTAGSEVPIEGSSPLKGEVNGSATVACVVSSSASRALAVTDGPGGSSSCTSSSLSPSQVFTYKVFQKDSRGNFDTGVLLGAGGAVPTPGGFNAFETSTGSGSVVGPIRTKLADSAFSLDLVALDAGGTGVLTSFSGDVAVDLIANTTTGVTLSGGCPVSGSVLPVGTRSLSAGRSTASFPAVSDVWRDVRVRIRYPASGTPTITACSTDNFAIKPATLAAVASHTNWQTAGTNTNLANSNASGGEIHKAGMPFTLRVSGYDAGSNLTSQYDGSPTAQITCVLPASGCVVGSLATGTFTASGGTVTSTTAGYSEVGAISASFTDSSFAAVDANDTGADCNGYYACSAAITIGRFVPDHFTVSANTPAFSPGCGSFTYLGQPFGFGTAPLLTVTAKNQAGATTANYTGSLWKISSATVTGQAWTSASGTVAPVGGLPGPTVTDLGAGTGTILFDVGDPASGGGLSFARSTGTAPFNASLGLSAAIVDNEGVAPITSPTTLASIGFDDGNGATSSDAQMRLGRLRLANAYGSERLALPVPLTAQYWDGQGFTTNTLDNCTSLAAPSLTFYTQNASNQLASGDTSATLNDPLVAGNGNLRLTAPGAGNHGFLDLSVTAPAWLRYNWDGTDQGGDGDLLDDNPRARASFGQRNNASRVIIRREIY